ncbi:hypothetical protein cypCar_00039028 [Cyprinus carpio]|nr:hypothetical protein cypCar_00039028 [Cyprinus carpio]
MNELEKQNLRRFSDYITRFLRPSLIKNFMTDYLDKDARTKDALDYLDAFFDQVRDAGYDETERKLTALYDCQRLQLLQLATEGEQNPKLDELRFILEEEYHSNDQTRAVMFIKTRALADNIHRMTLNNKKWILDSFKGSDQSRGRAEGSRCFLISSSEECIEKEKLNMFKEKMVEEAIEQLQKHPDISNQVDKLQKDDKTRRDLISASHEKPKTQGSYELLCSKCKRFACMSDDIRVVQV